MALYLIEGFDWMSTDVTDLDGKWSYSGANCVRGTGRFGGYSLRHTQTSTVTTSTAFGTYGIDPTSTNGVIFGFAYKHNEDGDQLEFAKLMFGGSTAGMLVKQQNNKIKWVASGTRTDSAVGSATSAIPTDTWAYIEVFLILKTGATGTLKIYVNGVEEVTATSVVTSAASSASNFVFAGFSSEADHYVDDFYLADKSGSGVTDVLGDVRVKTGFASDDATEGTAWTAYPGAGENWEEVDDIEADANKDDTYVETSAAATEDLYEQDGFGLASGDTVYGVQVGAVMKGLDASPPNTKLILKSGTTYSTPSAQTMSASYTSFAELETVNPDTSSAWTYSEANGVKIGLKTA